MKIFKQITPSEITDNVFKTIGQDWMLISAKNQQTGEFNMMTASWGGFGIMWNKPVFICMIRPQRHTSTIAENGEKLTLSFFTKEYRSALSLCGSKSGRDCDKAKEAGLTPRHDIEGAVYFDEARLVITGRKLYSEPLKADSFTDASVIGNCYSAGDFHRIYVCEITNVLIEKEQPAYLQN